MVATGTITIGYLGYLFPGTVGSWSIEVQGLLIIGFIVLSAVLALLRFLYLLGRRIEAAHRGGALPAAGSGS